MFSHFHDTSSDYSHDHDHHDDGGFGFDPYSRHSDAYKSKTPAWKDDLGHYEWLKPDEAKAEAEAAKKAARDAMPNPHAHLFPKHEHPKEDEGVDGACTSSGLTTAIGTIQYWTCEHVTIRCFNGEYSAYWPTEPWATGLETPAVTLVFDSDGHTLKGFWLQANQEGTAYHHEYYFEIEADGSSLTYHVPDIDG